ncbi:hypothetical protein GCM10010988_37670 [Cnuibacter physcomitrellae]|uniref:Uncharacterized protein n=1 Tax=Cnuibacter physcomitrellae TaxID=1619308 RepID=A0A1X9LJL2_9MICO|nr:hypothetical protein [Cnuibacter physcomitrellae]ARJ04672.1 hypothetical protein B5808_05100 [Cnuibacter physcomitrellae]MCS5499271.1 hypothetical protein [Cnuibacter physcomitrellae]GGI42165.1 hypothetical protein GCM10010988_37670 [Cnuibacter physcomitrellae]
MQSKRSRVAAAAFIAAGVAVVVNGCTLLEAVDPPIKSAIYGTAAEGKASGASIAVPGWVPDDATMVRMKANDDTGAELMQFSTTSPNPIGAPCSVPASQKPPSLDDTWWVETLPADEYVVCQDDWYLFTPNSGATYYAWVPARS